MKILSQRKLQHQQKRKKLLQKKAPQKGKLSFNENREFGSLESDIAKLQKKKERIEAQFSTGDIASEDINEASIELQKTISDLEQKEERWFELSMKLEG